MLDQQNLYEKAGALMDVVEDMRDRDYDFVMSIAEYEEQGRMFSQAQADWIEDLYRKHV